MIRPNRTALNKLKAEFPYLFHPPIPPPHALEASAKAVVDEAMRAFDTGATRSNDAGKLDFEGFLSPYALERYAQYLNNNRIQADGKVRDSDNWQKGIPKTAYMKSMWRHFFDVWKEMRGLSTKETLEENLCALLFNVMGLLHEIVKERTKNGTDTI